MSSPHDSSFDAYHRWLGISPENQPPDHYQLLGLRRFESHDETITNAADLRMAQVRVFQTSEHINQAQEILNEIALAKVCLLDADKKAAYDRQLHEATLNTYTNLFEPRQTQNTETIDRQPLDPPAMPNNQLMPPTSESKPVEPPAGNLPPGNPTSLEPPASNPLQPFARVRVVSPNDSQSVPEDISMLDENSLQTSDEFELQPNAEGESHSSGKFKSQTGNEYGILATFFNFFKSQLVIKTVATAVILLIFYTAFVYIKNLLPLEKQTTQENERQTKKPIVKYYYPKPKNRQSNTENPDSENPQQPDHQTAESSTLPRNSTRSDDHFWVDAMSQIALDGGHVLSGNWSRTLDGHLYARHTPARSKIIVPVDIYCSYDISLEFELLKTVFPTANQHNGGEVNLKIPVGSTAVTLAVSQNISGQWFTYLNSISNVTPEENKNSVKGRLLHPGKKYRYDVSVTLYNNSEAAISFELNGKQIFTWHGSYTALDQGDLWGPAKNENVEIGVDSSEVKFSSIRVRLRPYDPSIKSQAVLARLRAWNLSSKGRHDNALPHLNRAIKLNPHYNRAYFDRAAYWQQNSKFSQAFDDYNKVLELKPSYSAYLNQGKAKFLAGDINDAIQFYRNAMLMDRARSLPHKIVGDAYFEKNNFKAATENYYYAINNAPLLPELFEKRATAWIKLDKIPSAIDDMIKALQIHAGQYPGAAFVKYETATADSNFQQELEKKFFELNKKAQKKFRKQSLNISLIRAIELRSDAIKMQKLVAEKKQSMSFDEKVRFLASYMQAAMSFAETGNMQLADNCLLALNNEKLFAELPQPLRYTFAINVFKTVVANLRRDPNKARHACLGLLHNIPPPHDFGESADNLSANLITLLNKSAAYIRDKNDSKYFNTESTRLVNLRNMANKFRLHVDQATLDHPKLATTNREIALFEGIIKNDWQLAKKFADIAKDTTVQSIVKLELTDKLSSQQKMKLASLYDSITAQTSTSDPARTVLQLHIVKLCDEVKTGDTNLTVRDILSLNKMTTKLANTVSLSSAQLGFRTRKRPLAAIYLPSKQTMIAKNQWVDLLKLVNKVNQGKGTGAWRYNEAGELFSITQGVAKKMLPLVVDGDYELSIELERLRGEESVCVMLPVGSQSVTLIVNGRTSRRKNQAVTYISLINGANGLSHRQAIRANLLEPNKKYHFQIKVEKTNAKIATINFYLDRKLIFTWRGNMKALSPHPRWKLRDNQHIGIGTYKAPTRFNSIKFRITEGSAKSIVDVSILE